MIKEDIETLRRIASRGYATDEENQELFAIADRLEAMLQEKED